MNWDEGTQSKTVPQTLSNQTNYIYEILIYISICIVIPYNFFPYLNVSPLGMFSEFPY